MYINRNKPIYDITLLQWVYSEQILEYFNMTKYRLISTLLSLEITLTH